MSKNNKMNRQSKTTVLNILKDYPVLIGLAIRLILTFALPVLLDDGLIIRGVRYTDIDYDVFTDAAEHVAYGRSPYDRHTYRYTPFLARLLALPYQYSGGVLGVMLSVRYFGKILFCVADVICGYIIVLLRRQRRRSNSTYDTNIQTTNKDKQNGWKQYIITRTKGCTLVAIQSSTNQHMHKRLSRKSSSSTTSACNSC